MKTFHLKRNTRKKLNEVLSTEERDPSGSDVDSENNAIFPAISLFHILLSNNSTKLCDRRFYEV